MITGEHDDDLEDFVTNPEPPVSQPVQNVTSGNDIGNQNAPVFENLRRSTRIKSKPVYYGT